VATTLISLIRKTNLSKASNWIAMVSFVVSAVVIELLFILLIHGYQPRKIREEIASIQPKKNPKKSWVNQVGDISN
jgi:hypothetical protein